LTLRTEEQVVNRSAGILLYRRTGDRIFVLLVHPGGPFWEKRDFGAWSIPKGEHPEEEDPEVAARREFAEETGMLPSGPSLALGEIRQKAGKRVTGFAIEGDFDPATLNSNTFEIEWPPRSGRMRTFPEVDRAEWFALPDAREKILPAQRPFLDRLQDICDRA
jgi:predicted NUDIX family NTP pyrophosphohydrolase